MKNNIQYFTLLITFCLAGTTFSVNADGWFSSKRSGVAPVTNELYARECSECHFAYQPGLLPARSWLKLMSNLGDHFGDNAELSPADTKILSKYLSDNAAETSNHKRSIKISRSIGRNETPIRITDVDYIKRKHRELSRRHVIDNPEVGNLNKCEACHTRITEGSFSEREIKIPGFGRWEDD